MYLKHFGHPRSPLSTPELVKQAFFCKEFPLDQVENFALNMSPYESLLWPLAIMFRGYISLHRVLLHCSFRILVLAGSEDVLMRPEFMERTAAEYMVALGECERDGLREEGERGRVDFEVVEGSGHHVMNDLQWKDAVGVLVEWLETIGDDVDDWEQDIPGLEEQRRKQKRVY